MESLDDLVKQWLSVDVNPETRSEVEHLYNTNNLTELQHRLSSRITFGTAGLRARMGAGFSLMNDVTVLQASQGLASYVKSGSVVIGYDHRMNSQRFAMMTAVAFLLKGFEVYFLTEGINETGQVPTPLVPFAVDHYGASCGVMITASHNPALDNGYKVYWANGCQIIPPMDTEISESIMENLEPVEGAYELEEVIEDAEENDKIHYVKKSIISAYLTHLDNSLVKTKVSIPFVYTPMHGVGMEVFTQATHLLHVDQIVVVPDQARPDALFPTVKFPNPEEKGALALAIKTADSMNIKLVIANDPDADRFSCAVRVNDSWRQLTGNEMGFLFAQYMMNQYTDTPMDQIYLVNSTVSSRMIATMAKKLGCHYTETLTGFKWIGNKAIELEKQGYTVPFGFEEAIGFMFEGVHDKDGIAASLVFLQMAQEWEDKGTNALEVLDRAFQEYGYFSQYNSYYTVHDPSYTKVVFDGIRSTYKEYPAAIGDFTVEYWRDLTVGYQSDTVGNAPDLPTDARAQMITGRLARDGNSVSFTMRGSGTEPKLKVYVEAQAPTGEAAQQLAGEVWRTLRTHFFRPAITGLKEA